MPLKSRLQIFIDATYEKAAGITGTAAPNVPLQINRTLDMATGTGAGKADLLYQKSRSTAGNDDLDLAGVLLDDYGQTLTFVRVKALYIKNTTAAGGGNAVVGAGGANAWATLLNATGTLTLRPGTDMLVRAASDDATGYVVTAGTGDILRVAASAGTVTYDIAVFGTSA